MLPHNNNHYNKLYTVVCFIFLIQISYIESCIKLLNRAWKPVTLEERTKNADLVLTAKILYTEPLPGNKYFYSATFEVLNVLKGIDLLQKLHHGNSTTVKTVKPNIVATAIGFGDTKQCFSSVEEGESYALFLGYKSDKDQLIARYDDLFGAADRLYQRTERAILATLGWQEWSSWSKCTKDCGEGVQARTRGCRKSLKIPECHGPNEEKRQCNTFACKDSFDILTFILNQRKDHFSQWQPHDDQVFKNSINQPSPAKAPTYLLLSEFPKESVLHISFKGPVKETQFLHSIYDANNRMEFGAKVSPYTFSFTYDKKIDAATQSKRVVSYNFNFNEEIWYTIAIQLNKNEVSFRVNCGELRRAVIETTLSNNLDVYGQMYLGASSEFEKEKSRVRVEIGSIIISKDTESLSKQCGMSVVDNQETESKGEPNEGSGTGETVSEPDDSESGDVDEGYASGEGATINVKACNCLNGGICKANGICFCPRGWDGSRCEKPVCKNQCLNGGTCTAPNKCTCKPSTSGTYCQFNECQLPCKNNGDCIGLNKCRCKKGFEGPQCQYETCSQRCLNGGKCQSNGQCVCAKGFKGESCQYPENCKSYITKLVKYVKPATEILFYTEEIPCPKNKAKKCTVKRSKSMNVETTDYRQIYVCKT